MAKKKTDPIISLGKEEKLTVQKSLPLFSLWRSDLTLAEFKILDIYLSRIDSHKPEKRAVVFEKGELETVLGLKKINNKDLKERLNHLMGNVIEIPAKDTKKGFRLVTLFEEAIAEQNEDGFWQVNLECTQKAMKYFFNIENLGYLRYKLRCITSINSRYTYIMFIYLEANRYRKSWEVSVDELKKILACDTEELYKAYKFFNQKILRRVQKELLEKTECKYTYEPVKQGRKVAAIRFTIETLPKAGIEDIETDQLPIEQLPEDGREDALWYEAVEEFNFTTEQLEALKEVLICIPEDKMPQSIACVDSIEIKRYHYMRIKVSEIKRRKNVKNRFPYLLKMLKQDAEIQ